MPGFWRLAMLVIIGQLPPHAGLAGDWPQILGPNRNGIAVDESIDAWPAAGPKKLWSADLGAGFAGPAVAGNRVIVFHRAQRNERVECFDATTGKSSWTVDFPSRYVGGVNPDNGPRCVPLIHGERVYLFGAAGAAYCVSLVDGKKIWSRDLYDDYDGDEGYFGAGSTPIVADDKLLINVGGRQAALVALELATGKTAWTAGEDRASYSSPTSARIAGRNAVVFVTRLKCLAVDPANGELLFTLPFGKTGPTVNAATPLVIDEHLFLSASYGVGARLLTLTQPPQVVWSNDESMSSQYTTCVQEGGQLYGIHGREDFGNGELRCIDTLSGKVRWTVPGFGTGHLIRAGKRLLILTTDGELVLAEVNPDRFVELARAKVSRSVTRSLPALAEGRLYFRENPDSGGQLHCVRLD